MEKYSVVLSITPAIPNISLVDAKNKEIQTYYSSETNEYSW